MRLNTHLLVMVSGLLLLSPIGHIMTRGAPPGSDEEIRGPFGFPWLNPLAFILSGLMKPGGSSGAFFAGLLQAAISRQREYLADASAVEFTRQTDGIVGALRKIGGWKTGSALWQPHAMKASHPPLAARIKALEPEWDGRSEHPAEE
jgi:Zn-dependent protease with chaperone function